MTGDKLNKPLSKKRSWSLRKAPGYSLTELLVVMLLFSMAMLILSQTYIQFMRLSNKTANAATVQQDARFAMEFFARAMRTAEVDYSSPVLASDTELRLFKLGGDSIMIKKSAVGDALCADAPTISCLLVTTDSGATWAPLTSKNVNVDVFKVYVQPTASPFELSGFNYTNNNQPFAAITLTLTYNARNPRESFTQTVQTGISSRVYVR
jgi:prepilin-type N-terminal cleavage/methylation domain-containing protein